MRTVSYIFIKEPTGEIFGSAALRGALCYTGRVLLQQFKTKERIERLVSNGPIDLVGLFPDEAEGLENPAFVQPATDVGRLPKFFRTEPVKLDSIDSFHSDYKNHNHMGSVNFFVFDNNEWYYAKHNIKKLQKLTMTLVDFDDEDVG